MQFYENYLRAIGAIHGNHGVDWWGKSLDSRCKDFEGGKLLETFLSKYFCLVYYGEKLLGEEGIETGTSTMGGKDIVLDLRFDEALTKVAGDPLGQTTGGKRIMFLIQYHS